METEYFCYLNNKPINKNGYLGKGVTSKKYEEAVKILRHAKAFYRREGSAWREFDFIVCLSKDETGKIIQKRHWMIDLYPNKKALRALFLSYAGYKIYYNLAMRVFEARKGKTIIHQDEYFQNLITWANRNKAC